MARFFSPASGGGGGAPAVPESHYINWNNTNQNLYQSIGDLVALKYEDLSAEVILGVHVESGYTRSLVELNGTFQNSTDPTVEAVLKVQFRISSGPWVDIQHILVSGTEYRDPGDLRQIYQVTYNKIIHTHGAPTGSLIEYRFINDTNNFMSNGSPLTIYARNLDTPTTAILTQIA